MVLPTRPPALSCPVAAGYQPFQLGILLLQLLQLPDLVNLQALYLQTQKVCSENPAWWICSTTATPISACSRTATICSTRKRFRLTAKPPPFDASILSETHFRSGSKMPGPLKACSCRCPIGAHRKNDSFQPTPDTHVQLPSFATSTILFGKREGVHTGSRHLERSPTADNSRRCSDCPTSSKRSPTSAPGSVPADLLIPTSTLTYAESWRDSDQPRVAPTRGMETMKYKKAGTLEVVGCRLCVPMKRNCKSWLRIRFRDAWLTSGGVHLDVAGHGEVIHA